MRTQEYHFYMAISLDGEEKYHNMVRGNKKLLSIQLRP